MGDFMGVLARCYSRLAAAGIKRSDVTQKMLFSELRAELPGYLAQIEPMDVYRVCRAKICDSEHSSDQAITGYTLLVEACAVLVQLEIDSKLKYEYCVGCNYVDSLGLKGHPSQRHHQCLMDTRIETLDRCFSAATVKAQKRRIPREFLQLLKRHPAVYM